MKPATASKTSAMEDGSSGKLAGLAEVAAICGVSKSTAQTYTVRRDFPKPLDRLAAGPVWSHRSVETWAARTLPLPTGRPPTRRKGAR